MLDPTERAFATGVSEYTDAFPGLEEPLSRIYVPVQPEGFDTWHLALVDTGGHFFIPNRSVLASMRDELADSFDFTWLMTAQGRVKGEVYRHRIALIAVAGDDLDVDTTVFASRDWMGPSVLGYTGML